MDYKDPPTPSPSCCFTPELVCSVAFQKPYVVFLPAVFQLPWRTPGIAPQGFALQVGSPHPPTGPSPAAPTFRSRWTTPIWWQCRTASRICWMQWLWEKEESSQKCPARQSLLRHFYLAAFHSCSPSPHRVSHQQPCSTAQRPPPPKATHPWRAAITQ